MTVNLEICTNKTIWKILHLTFKGPPFLIVPMVNGIPTPSNKSKKLLKIFHINMYKCKNTINGCPYIVCINVQYTHILLIL